MSQQQAHLDRQLPAQSPSTVPGLLQRACACGKHKTDQHGECAECRKKRLGLQRRAVAGAAPVSGPETAPPIVHEVLRAPGRPLDDGTRGFMESRFGQDFSGVRVHTDRRAAESARAVNALAYTVGNHVAFGAGQFAPGTQVGRGLLAHELAHTVQQGGGATLQRASLAINKPNDAGERDAERLAARAMGADPGRGHTPTGRPLLGNVLLQRTIGDGHDLRAARFAGDLVLEACFDDERLLQFGDSGPAVAKLQQALVDAGFPLPVFGVDGLFKSETRTAVRDFQRSRGLDPDGLVGPLTMGSLDTLFAVPGPPPPPVAETITSETVVTQPGLRTRTTIGVGEEVNLTHAPGSATWSTTAGTLSATSGVTIVLTAPDTAQRLTVTAGGATLDFIVLAPTAVVMDREPGTGVKHTQDQPDSGVQTRVFLGPDTVNFSRARYREIDVGAITSSPGAYSCFTTATPHCGAGVGNPCPDKALLDVVVAGMGTQSELGDCAYSGFCIAPAPFVPGSIMFVIPYEYRVGAGSFHRFTTVVQIHTLAADASTLTSSKAGANGTTNVAAATVVQAACP